MTNQSDTVAQSSQLVEPSGAGLTLRGPKILIEGPTGTGKTTALGTAADWATKHGWHVYALFTENSTEVFRGYWRDRGLSVPNNVHIADVLVKPTPLKSLIKAADQVGKLTYQSLCQITDNTRGDNNAYKQILEICAEFKDTASGEIFGMLEDFPTNSIFIMDSLSETANAAFKMQVGNKPTADKPDYQVAQINLLNFIRLLTQGIRCAFILTAHVDMLFDDFANVSKINTKSIGKALVNELSPLFSDVILTKREGREWLWDTENPRADLKTRNLPVSGKIKPDFGPLFDKWLVRATQGEV